MKLNNSWARLLTGQDLREKEARSLFSALFKGKLAGASEKNLLLLLARKGESADEVVGCLKALRSLEPLLSKSLPNVIDTCGIGGDGADSINVTTLASLVIAGAGGRIAKHGNRKISSKCGSSDLLERLGVKLEAPPHAMLRAVRKAGMGYFHAPFYHPIFSSVQPLRRKLKRRTIFNFLGPLSNPVQVSGQMIGVSEPESLRLFAQVFQRLKMPKTVLICRSRDGMDELSTAAVCETAWVSRGKIKYHHFQPWKLGFRKARKGDFKGGSAESNARIARQLLTGKLSSGPVYDIVVLNAAAGLVVSGKAKNLPQGIRQAKESLASGKANRALTGLVKISRGQA